MCLLCGFCSFVFVFEEEEIMLPSWHLIAFPWKEAGGCAALDPDVRDPLSSYLRPWVPFLLGRIISHLCNGAAW